MAERIIGIDFGTSTSVVRIKRYDKGRPLGAGGPLETGSLIFHGSYPTVPTVIQKVGENRYYGYDALVKKTKEAVLYQGFKVNLESEIPALREEARALTAEFLRYLHKVYQEQSNGGFLGEIDDQERTYISYPVKWSQESKRFMVEAAAQAGFPRVEGLDEAQAAIHAVTLQSGAYLQNQGYLRPGIPCTMLLVDMGAGTTDLALCRHTPGPQPVTDLLCTWPTKGETLFGGQEVESLLRQYAAEKLPEEVRQMAQRCGLEKFKAWKEELVAPALAHGDQVDGFSDLDTLIEACGYETEPYQLNRDTFERYGAEYLKQLPQLVRGCIRAAGIPKEQVELVLLTGGHSQWYFVREMLQGKKPELCEVLLPQIARDEGRILAVPRPQETVALGLAYRPLRLVLRKREAAARKPEPQPANPANPANPAKPVNPANRADPVTPPASSHTRGEAKAEGTGPAPIGGAEAEAWFQHGRELTQKGQAAEAGRWYRLAGQAGHAEAQWCLGTYYDGLQDYQQAAEWIRRSAEQGFPKAQLSYALLLCRGAGVGRDYVAAASWCSRAATQGEETAQDWLPQLKTMAQVARDMKRAEKKGAVLNQLPLWAEQFVGANGSVKRNQGAFREDTLPALRERLSIPAGQKVFLAHDDTLMHSGKNGYCLTTDGIYCRELLEKPHVVKWRALLYYRLDPDQNIELFTPKGVVKKRLFYHTGSEKEGAMTFFQGLQQYLRQRVKQMGADGGRW